MLEQHLLTQTPSDQRSISLPAAPVFGLAPCHSRRDVNPERGVYFCAHPNVHSQDNLVDREICVSCRYGQLPPPDQFRPFPPEPRHRDRGDCFYLGERTGLRDCPTCTGNVRLKVFACQHPLHEETTQQECLVCPEHERQLPVRSGSSAIEAVPPSLSNGARAVGEWAVGVTATKRNPPTLERTLYSLANAGWHAARIFAEPGLDLPGTFAHLEITRRDRPLGAWPNWFLGLVELVQRRPQADAYMMVQDDVVFSRNVRNYLEQALWPEARLALVSIYCPTPYVLGSPGLHAVDEGTNLTGALAYVIPAPAARSLVANPGAINHRRNGPHEGTRHVDCVVGRWAKQAGLRVYYQTPSLAQHIGDSSTVWPGAANADRRRAPDFLGEDFDAQALLRVIPMKNSLN